MYVVVNVATAASCGAIDPTNVILLGAPSTSAPVASTSSSEPIEQDADNEGSFSFGSLHAALGQGFVQDRLKRRQEKEQQQEEEEEGQLREKTPTTVEETRTTVVVDAIQLATVSSSSDDSKENDPGLLSSI